MKRLSVLLLGCGLLLVSSNPYQINACDDLLFSNEISNGGGVKTALKLAATENKDIDVGQTYFQVGKNDSYRLLRFCTPVSGDFTSIKYYVSIEGYSVDPIIRDVNVVYKGVSSNDKINYFNGEDIVNEEDDSTSSWYWACYTIQFETKTYYEANISAYVVVSNGESSKTSTKKENVKLSDEITCPIEFNGKNSYESGTTDTIEINVPNGVTYNAYLEKNETYYSDYNNTLPTEEGTYALVVETEENDTYDATRKWFIFTITAKEDENKITPTIEFDFEAGTSFALGIEPTYIIKDEEGNEIKDADVTIKYTSDETGYNSSVLPTTAGAYGLTVTVNESDKYNTISNNRWFRVTNEIITTISSNVTDIHEGSIENIIDGDESTYCWFKKAFEEGDYIQLDYSYPKEISKVSFLFDNRESKSDYFKFKLQYLDENNEYQDLSEEMDTFSSIISFNAVTTKSIRLLSTSSMGSTWNYVSEIRAYLAPNVINNGFTYVEYSNNNLNNLSDEKLSSYTFFDWKYTSSCNVILDYEKEMTVNTITLLTGCDEHPDDYAQQVKFSYSLDGSTYVDIDGVYEGKNIRVQLDSSIQARYIKMTPILEGESGNGLTIREFGINYNKFDVETTYGEEVAFTYDGEAHYPTYYVPYGVSYKVYYESDPNKTEAVNVGWYSLCIEQNGDEDIYNLKYSYKVFHIDE